MDSIAQVDNICNIQTEILYNHTSTLKGEIFLKVKVAHALGLSPTLPFLLPEQENSGNIFVFPRNLRIQI